MTIETGGTRVSSRQQAARRVVGVASDPTQLVDGGHGSTLSAEDISKVSAIGLERAPLTPFLHGHCGHIRSPSRTI